jgi:hypothetical protein
LGCKCRIDTKNNIWFGLGLRDWCCDRLGRWRRLHRFRRGVNNGFAFRGGLGNDWLSGLIPRLDFLNGFGLRSLHPWLDRRGRCFGLLDVLNRFRCRADWLRLDRWRHRSHYDRRRHWTRHHPRWRRVHRRRRFLRSGRIGRLCHATTLDDCRSYPFLDDLGLSFALLMSAKALNGFGGNHAHVVANFGKPHGLKERNNLLVIQAKFARYFINSQLAAHPTSVPVSDPRLARAGAGVCAIAIICAIALVIRESVSAAYTQSCVPNHSSIAVTDGKIRT